MPLVCTLPSLPSWGTLGTPPSWVTGSIPHPMVPVPVYLAFLCLLNIVVAFLTF